MASNIDELEEQINFDRGEPITRKSDSELTDNERYSNLYAKQHRIYERRAYPIFLRALHDQVAPTLKWITDNQDVNPPLDALVVPGIWRSPMIEVYEMIGTLSARREYFYMRNTDKGVLDFIITAWRQIFYTYAINYAYRIENELSETTKEEIRKALAYSYENSLNADQTASHIRSRVYNEISRSRAVMIARTETTTAASLGKETGARQWLADQGQQGYKQWIGREDDRERGRETDTMHWHLNDQIIPIDDKFVFTDTNGITSYGLMPGDVNLPANQRINCYLPDTIIESNIIGGQKSFYSGKVVEIITAGGIRLSITPNHEILTKNGFVKAKDLANGDDLICNLAKKNWLISLVDNYINKKPTRADDIFRAIKVLWGSQLRKIGALDFNGDAEFMNNNVDIVSPNIELPIDGAKCIGKNFGKLWFRTSRTQTRLIKRLCGFNSCFKSTLSSSDSFMSFLNLPLSFSWRHFRPFKFFSIGRVSNLNASRFKSSREGYTDDSTFLAELLHADAGLVSFDKVAKIRYFDYSGHVYDFSSLNGVNIANNIYTSNCRCTLIYMSQRRYERIMANRNGD